MLKRQFSIIIICVCTLVWAAPGLAAQSRPAEKSFRLALVGTYPDKHPVVEEVFVPWAASIAEKSRNRLIITYYGPNILLPEETHFEAVRKGTAAMAMQATAMTPGRLHFSTFLNIPGGMSSSRAGTAAYWRMFRNAQEMRREYEDFKLITLHASPPVQLHLSFSLRDVYGLRGRRIICQDSYLAAMLRGVGAEPLILPESSHYQALAKNEADGVALPFDMVMAHNLDSFPFKQTLCLNLSVSPYWLIMNNSAWSALPRDLQRIIELASGEELGMRIAGALDMAAAAGKARMAGKGVYMRELSRAERESWREAMGPPARDLWLSYMKSERVQDPEKFLERAGRFYREAETAHGR